MSKTRLLRLALPLVLATGALASSAGAAELLRGEPVYRSTRRVVVDPAPAAELLPACEERWNADLLRCLPRQQADEDSYAVKVRRKTMLTFPAQPYPQLFNWDFR